MTLNAIDDTFISQLNKILPKGVICQAEPRYLEEPRGQWAGQKALLARPETTEQVSSIIKIAYRSRVAVIPYGGGTGLVGGQIMPVGPKPLILSLERMNKIRQIYASENILITEAGATLTEVQTAAAEVGRLFPLSLAAEGSARIGGNLATNAGGINVLRYGSARDLCIGLEVVLPDGKIWNGLSRLVKDNTGYDLRHLVIGAEGTLGVITAASLKLFDRPSHFSTAFLEVASPDAALKLLSLLRANVGGAVSAFELLHKQGFDFLSEKLPKIRLPFKKATEWMVLLEIGFEGTTYDKRALEDFFIAGQEKQLLTNAIIAQSEGQRQEFWSVRENIPEANRLIGAISSHDISLPLSAIPEFINRAKVLISKLGAFRVNCFGHLGDGNLHFNVFPAQGKSNQIDVKSKNKIKSQIHQLVDSMEGSISAEHGIGRLKISDLEHYADPAKLTAMRAIKDALDPRGIMNPGVLFRELAD